MPAPHTRVFSLDRSWLAALLALVSACSESEGTPVQGATSSSVGGAANVSTATSTTSSSSGNTTTTSGMTSTGAIVTGSATTTNTSTDTGGATATNSVGASSSGAGGMVQTATGGTGGTGGTNGGGNGGCAQANYVICEDFETTPVGAIPEGWSRHGDEIAVADDEAYAGERALKMGAIPVWERRIYHDANDLGNAHWGRVHYKVQLPVPDAFVHSTLVALTGNGPLFGPSEFRVVDTVKQAIDTPDVGSQHQFLYNVQPENSGEFGRQGPYDQAFDDQWHCAEYRIDATNQSYALYIDGAEELSFEDGAGNYEDSDIPDSFEELRIGWINYQESPPGFTAWIDEVAFGPDRIGCAQ